MKKSVFNISAALAMAIIAGGCADDTFDRLKGYDRDRDMTLTLRLPSFATAATRAADENALADVKVYFLDSSGAPVADESVVPSPDGSTTKVTLTVPAGTTRLKLYGNYDTYCAGASPMVTSVDPNAQTVLPFYGEAGVAELESGGGTIDMLRACAKTTMATGADTGLTILAANLHNAPQSGMMAGGSADGKEVPNIPDDAAAATLEATVDGTGGIQPMYHFEAQAGDCFWTLQTDRGWYKIAYIENAGSDTHADDGENTPEIAILRNHHYKFVIEKVNADGWDTEEEAIKAAPENRLSVLLTDRNETIYDMISCRDYYLGISERNIVDASAGNGQGEVDGVFEFVTNCKDYIKISDDATLIRALDLSKLPAWVHEDSFTIAKGETSVDGAVIFTIGFTVDDNLSGNDRSFIVPVKIGDLVREVTVTQSEVDYFDGVNGITVGIKNLNDAALKSRYGFKGSVYAMELLDNAINYFAFVRNSLKGVTADDMDVERGDGLHFSVYVENAADQYEYLIQHIQGEALPEILEGGEFFAVENKTEASTGKHYWRIHCTPAGNENYRIWSGRLRVRTVGKEVVYRIYHAGIFHMLDGTWQVPGPDGDCKTGWFYYEQTDVTGTDGGTYHILDRNLGAAGNKAFSPTSSFNSANTASRGAYFYIPQSSAAGNPGDPARVEAVFPAGYAFPEVYHLANMGLKVFNGSEGSYGWDTGGGSLLRRIYLPTAGTMEGAVNAEDTRAYIWSSSMVVGNQGFYEGEKEYGQWFRSLEAYGSVIDYSKMTRIISRATGNVKGVPVRAMAAPDPVPGWELPTVAEGRSRVILRNTAGWSDARVTTTGGKNPVTDMQMTKGDDDGTWFYVDLKGIPVSARFSGGGTSTGQMQLSFSDGIAVCDNDGAEEVKTGNLTVYARIGSGCSWSTLRIHYWGGTNPSDWTSRPQMTTEVINGTTWYKYTIKADNTGMMFTDSGESKTKEYNISVADTTIDQNIWMEVSGPGKDVVYLGNGATPPGGGGDDGDDNTNRIYRIYWTRYYNSNELKYFNAWRGPQSWNASDGSHFVKEGTVNPANSNQMYIEFTAPAAESFSITCAFLKGANDWSVKLNNAEPVIESTDFTKSGSIYSYTYE